jgi:PAS domain S-box-containing protein
LLVAEDSGKIVDANPQAETLLGRTRGEIIGMNQRELYPRQNEWSGFPMPREESAGVYETEVLCKNGTTIPTDVSISRMQLQGRSLLLLQLRSSREQLRALAARLQAVREEERTRVAREIHDELGQMLTALKMDLRCIEQDIERVEDSRLNPVLDKAVGATELTDSLAKSVQRIAAELRPGILDRLGLVTALAYEAEQFQQRTGIICHLKTPPEEPALQVEAVTAVFRIFQEAMTNIARHAGASEVHIQLEFQPQALALEIRDNGKGIQALDLFGTCSLGVLGMQERARQLGGEVVFRAGIGGGTIVALQIPNPQNRTALCST